MALTAHQREVADDVIKSVETSDRRRMYTCLSGIGGVGKTFTTNEIVKELQHKGYKVDVTSTTHQACSVLTEELEGTGIEVRTINSFLKMKPVYESQELVLRTQNLWDIEMTDVLVIDEFSMLTEIVINTLEAYVTTVNENLKVLLVGDATQLIMEPGTIKKLNIEDNIFWLLEPMRARPGSDLAEYGHKASEAIRSNKPSPKINFSDDGDIIKYTDHKKFIQAWKDARKRVDPSDMKILCFTNAKVRSYNKHIKEDFYNQAEEYAPGNIIVIRNPVVLQNSSDDKEGTMIPNNKRLVIKDVKPLKMNLANGTEEKGWSIYPEGYIGYFNIPKSKAALARFLQPLVDKKDWRNYYKNKNRFCIAHHADSGTVHSSQGSSFDEVFIDATDIMQAQNFKNRLAYVSITRARKKAHIFVGEERNFKAFKEKKKK